MLLLQLLIAISASRRTEINIILICHRHREGRKAALLCADGHYAKIYQTWWSFLLSWLNVLNRGRSLRDTISSSSNSFNSISLRGTKNEWLQILFSKRQFQMFTPSKFKDFSESFNSIFFSQLASIQFQLPLFQVLCHQAQVSQNSKLC